MNTVKRFKKTFAVTLSVMIVIVASTSVIFADDTINNGVTPTPPIESGVLMMLMGISDLRVCGM